MDIGTQIRAGKLNQHTFTLRQGYEAWVGEREQAARAAAAQAVAEDKLPLEQVEAAVAKALEPFRITDPDDYFREVTPEQWAAGERGYGGSFTVHRPNLGDQIAIENHAARLADHIPEDRQRVAGYNLATMSAVVMVVVDKGPHWYAGPLALEDSDTLLYIHTGWRAWVDSFRR